MAGVQFAVGKGISEQTARQNFYEEVKKRENLNPDQITLVSEKYSPAKELGAYGSFRGAYRVSNGHNKRGDDTKVTKGQVKKAVEAGSPGCSPSLVDRVRKLTNPF